MLTSEHSDIILFICLFISSLDHSSSHIFSRSLLWVFQRLIIDVYEVTSANQFLPLVKLASCDDDTFHDSSHACKYIILYLIQ